MNRSIRLLLVGAFFWDIGEGMLGPLLSIYTQQIGGDILDLSWAWGVYMLVTGVCMVGVGTLSDRVWPMERLMVVGYGLNALCTFGYLLISSPAQLLLVQAGLGVARALATPTWDALYSRHAAADKIGLLWGAAHGQEYIVLGLAMLLGGYVLYFGSFALLFTLMGSVQVLATLVQARILWYPSEKPSSPAALVEKQV